MVDGEEVDDIEEFTYLGAILDKEFEGSKDIMHRLQNSCGAFQRLLFLWLPRPSLRRTKILLFKT